VDKLIKKVWNVLWNMWEHCNGILHNSEQAKHNILEEKINGKISAICANGTQVLPRDAIGLLQKPKEHALQLPLWTKQQWVD